ncbi:MAG: hypothetical protein ACE5HO_14440 [bacterium]
MNENLRSMLLGPSPLYAVAAVALILTLFRPAAKPDPTVCNRFVHLFLLGIACQCLHFVEEFLTGFHIRLPSFLGLAPWPGEFFVTFNLAWIALWTVSAVGIHKHFQPAYFPVWFFSLSMIANAIFHPLLAIATSGYFPGLVTSPIVGIIGIVLTSRLWELTK